MTVSGASFRRFVVLFLCFTGLFVSLHAQQHFSVQLSQGGLTSAGIFDSNGRIVRTLWALETFNAGNLNCSWDGLDDFGTPAPPGTYTWKVLRNGAQYNNIGVIGNTGLPPITSGHVPSVIEGVALDSQGNEGNVYTVHNWDEPHFDVIRWSPADGKSAMNTGHAIGEALLKAIAVEPDGSFAYVTGYGDSLADRTKCKFSIWRINMAPQVGESERVVNFTQQGRSIKVYDGNVGGYPNAGYPTPEYPANATEADKEVMRMPLISIAVQGTSLYVTDAIGGRILKYDKVSGNYQSAIGGIPVACGLAIAPNGSIWVGHDHTKVSVYSPSGVRLATPIVGLTEVRALSIQGNMLAVADRVGVVRKYTISSGTQVTLTASYGLPQRPGDRKPERLSSINGMAMDASGNIYISDRLGDGSRLQKIDSQLTPVWQQMCLEFSASAAYGKANPDLLISSYRKAYQIDKVSGQWTLLGTAKTDVPKRYFGNYESTHLGPPRIVRFGSTDFYYYPAGDSLAIYRIEPPADAERGPTLKLASVLGSSQPSPDGVHRDETWRPENRYLWEWNDTQSDGDVQYTPRSDPGQAGEVTLLALPGVPHANWQWFRRAFEVDDAGWLWLASAVRDHVPDASYPSDGEAIYVIPCQGLNSIGNPIYSWRDVVKVMDAATGRNALNLAAAESFEWKMSGKSEDGMVYALAWSNKTGLPQDGAAWMGGNVLFGFWQPDAQTPTTLGEPKWRVVLPKQSVGMVPIPGGPGGVLVGIDPGRGTVGHFTKDGLLIGSMKSSPQFSDPTRGPWVVGGLDSYMAVNCNRDPRDGLVDVFVEDNLNQRIVWYRVNDSNIQTVGQGPLNIVGSTGTGNALTVINGTGDGTYPAGTTVNLAATAPPTNKVFAAWTGDTTGVANVTSPNTTLVMPDKAVTLTATYKWASGNDKIRFYPEPNQEHQMLTCLWEGTNGDRDTGPYEVFYQPEQIPNAGWNEVMVNTKGFRYLRWRQTTGNGMIRELEWYRSGAKITGPFFGTSGSWQNNPNETWEKAVDGNTSTGFNGPDVSQPGWINAYIGVDSRPRAYTLTVNNGTGSGSYDVGMTVLVSAREPVPGEAFAWTGDKEILANWLLPTTSALMPSRDVTITAIYGAGSTLTVNNGSGSGSYPVGTTVNVIANAPPAGQAFASWTGDTVILADEDPFRASTTAVIPSLDVAITATYAVNGTGTGLRGQYYNDPGSSSYPLANPFTGTPVLTRTDATVDFVWGENSPGTGISTDNFSVKWTGQVEAPVSGTYTFTARGDDGVRLYLSGVKVADGWSDHGATDFTCTTNLTAGTKYDIELHFYEHGGGAECKLQWSYPGQARQAIPQSRLYAPITQHVAAPVFNPPPGTYSSAQSVAIITSTPGATIRYTIDGSDPSDSSGTLYSGPVPISGTTTLKAIAYKTGMTNSSVTSGTYTIHIVPTYTLTVNSGSGGGSYTAGTTVYVSANTPPAGQQFAGWTGDTNILSSQAASTTATMPSSNASLTATFSAMGGAGTGLHGQYYNDGGVSYPLANPFTGTPVLTRTDATVDFVWGEGSPGAPVTINNFSAKWTGKVKPPVTGSYTFTVRGDDGVRLFINGAKVIDGWSDHGPTDFSYTTNLAAGTMYDVELHFYENGGGAECKLHWSYPGQPDQAIPRSQLWTTGAVTREVWTAVTGDRVSNIPTGSAPTFTDRLTSFEAPSDWADNYGTRVRGYITAPATGSYRFWIASDNASELWLSTNSIPANKRRIARVIGRTNSRQWTKESNQRSAAISLVQGQIYYVEALQKEGVGSDNLAVGWAKPGQSTSAPSEIIPGAVLFPF
jgi:PA14 domain/Chitobiase/beta-hexosaminidase C-terminal domain/Divergent InlB B-repeat domain/FlgD Ig-like domain